MNDQIEVNFMLEIRSPIKIGLAIEKIMLHSLNGAVERISIDDCDDRFLAEDVFATHDVPLFTRSGYDGYAIRSEDTSQVSPHTPIELKVMEELGAGMVPKQELMPFEATRIMTGAMVPKGADAVIMLELVKEIEKNSEKYIVIKRNIKKGENISYQAEEARSGELLIKKGTRINPGVKAVLATFGYAEVNVSVKPKVGIFATGSELLDVDEKLQDGKIRNSNSYMISSQVNRAGAEPIYFGKLPDEIETCFKKISETLKEVDILITTGGVSVGDYDYMPEIYKRLQGEVLFNKVAIRPGSVTTVTVLSGKLLFGLSGNPSASYVGFELFVRPIIRKMLFCENSFLKFEWVKFGADFPRPNPFTRFVRSKLHVENGELITSPVGIDKSNIVMSLAKTDSLTIFPGGTRGFSKGDYVNVLLLDDHEGSRTLW
jgi:molybdopterin molybdotransferase